MADTASPANETSTENGKKRTSYAVVVIHGIGEQRPMDTVRGFVESVLPDAEDGVKYFSKPDRLSESFELRKLQNRRQPRLHFYEYYWAYHVEGTAFRHVISWARSLLFRRPTRVPPHLKALWTITWLLVVLIVAGLALGTISKLKADLISVLPQAGFAIAAISAILLTTLQGIILYYVGDAARYLSPHPQNISLRQEIRKDGLRLLRNLHRCGEYDRIILVGHSLGSVIAYDLLKHLWLDYNENYATPSASNQPALGKLEEIGHALSQGGGTTTVEQFQTAQHELWKEMRGLGSSWLVTDLITLGSPLAHAGLLLANDPIDLEERKKQRELPICPPVEEITHFKTKDPEYHYSYRRWDKFPTASGDVALRVLHHAAPFACTRWTNLYFPVAGAVLGDIIAGPLQPVFGLGIADRPVTTSLWGGLAGHVPIAHNQYWWKAANGEPSSERESIDVLCKAMDCPFESKSSTDE